MATYRKNVIDQQNFLTRGGKTNIKIISRNLDFLKAIDNSDDQKRF